MGRAVRMLLRGIRWECATSAPSSQVVEALSRAVPTRRSQSVLVQLAHLARGAPNPPIYGSAGSNGRVWIRRRIFYGNPFQIRFAGRLERQAGATVLRGRLGLGSIQRSVAVTIVVGNVLLMALGIGGTLSGNPHVGAAAGEWAAICVLGVILAVQLGVLAVAARIGEQDMTVISGELERALGSGGRTAPDFPASAATGAGRT